ncbi:MAG: YggS family pyridoxal phosphate-dependent enzyme [Pyrinomonadaceae bacterium]|nr:YggS family pyridoxal phosphate-dependent enzyme [Pyrinomonadaceae bacterium]
MSIAERYKDVVNQVSAAAVASNRDPEDVSIVAVSKTHPASYVEQALSAGARVFGENKVQEGVEKAGLVESDEIEWHLIGHLQKNKVRKAVLAFDVIQTIDSLKLAQRVDRIADEESRYLKVFVQLNLAAETSKFGASESELLKISDFLASASSLEFAGLMAIPPFFKNPEDVRPYFRKLRELRDELREDGIFSGDSGWLSMGMSQDFPVAIDEGATHVRIGTAIFGQRG